MNKLIFLISFVISSSAHSATGIYKSVWMDMNGKHDVTLTVMDGGFDRESSAVILHGEGKLNNKQEWVINDSVKNCTEDSDISIYPNSFELLDLLKKDDYYILFSYRISCSGSIDPGIVKYFAYRNGIKYSLRGEEHIIMGSDSFGGEISPAPDFNLKNNKPLLEYMLKKWPSVSTTRIN